MQITWGTLLANKEFTEKLLLAGCSKCYGMKRGNVKSSCQICCTYCSTASEILEIKRLLFGRTTRVLRELQHTRPASPQSLASLPFLGSACKSWLDANNQLMPPTSQLGFLCCEGCGFLLFRCSQLLRSPPYTWPISEREKAAAAPDSVLVCRAESLVQHLPNLLHKGNIFKNMCNQCMLSCDQMLKTQIVLEGLEWYRCHPSWQNH